MYDSIECIESNKSFPMVVEVFKTNVQTRRVAEMIIADLIQFLPNARINFDLEDCDNILRIECQQLVVGDVIEIVEQRGHSCEVLE
jgi:hypothetical protein